MATERKSALSELMEKRNGAQNSSSGSQSGGQESSLAQLMRTRSETRSNHIMRYDDISTPRREATVRRASSAPAIPEIEQRRQSEREVAGTARDQARQNLESLKSERAEIGGYIYDDFTAALYADKIAELDRQIAEASKNYKAKDQEYKDVYAGYNAARKELRQAEYDYSQALSEYGGKNYEQNVKDAETRLANARRAFEEQGGNPDASVIGANAKAWGAGQLGTLRYFQELNRPENAINLGPITIGGGDDRMPAEMRAAIEAKQKADYEAKNGVGTWKPTYQRTEETAARMQRESAEDIASIKAGRSEIGQVAVDVAGQSVQMGLDAAFNVGKVIPGGSLTSMALRTFGTSAQEAKDQGATLGEQGLYGAGSAAVEVLTEKMFDGLAGVYGAGAADDIVSHMIGKITDNRLGQAALEWAADALGEGLEEVASDAVNPLLQTIYNDMSVGESYRENLDWQEVGYDFLIGALMGFAGGSVENITNITGVTAPDERSKFFMDAGQRGMSFKNAMNTWHKLMISEGYATQTSDQEITNQANEYLNRLESGKRVSERKINKLNQRATNTIAQEDIANTVNGVQQRMQQFGINDPKLAQAITAVALENEAERIGAKGVGATEAQRNMVEDSSIAKRILSEMDVENMRREQAAGYINTLMEMGGASDEELQRNIEPYQRTNEWVKNLKGNKALASDVYGTQNTVTEAEKNAVTMNGESVKIVGAENGKVTIEQNGERQTVDAGKLENMSDSYKQLVSYAPAGQSGEAFLRLYKSSQDVAAYAKAWDLAENMYGAQTNVSFDEARQRSSLKVLTDAQLQMALDIGRERYNANKAKAEERGKQLKQAREEAKKRGAEQRKKGTVSYDGGEVNGIKYKGIDKSKLSVAQKRVVAMVEALADAVNIDYVLFEGEANTGGSYIQGGTVYINIKAGEYSGKTLGAATLSHELTHFLQDFAPEEYQELKDFLIAEIIKQSPAQFEKLVQKQLMLEPDLNYDQATDEMIANACQKMLLNSEAVTKLARQNMSLAEKIRDAISEISDKIKAAFEDVDMSDNVPVFEAARSIENVMDKAQALWDKALEAATENYNAAQATGMKSDGGVQSMAIGYTTDNVPVAIISENILDGVPQSEWVATVKDVMKGRFANGVPISGRLIKVNAITRREYAASNDTSYYRANDGTIYEDKLKAAGGLDDILLASTNYINEDLNHNRKDNFKEFARGDVLMRIGGNDYSAKVIVGFTTGNAMVLYDVVDFQPTTIQLKNKKQMLSTQTNGNEAEIRSTTSTSGTSIADESAKSKQQFQMLEPVEQTDKLVAVHNKSISGLRRMLQRGGVPFPSIAIKKAGTPHEGFGDVSIVFPRSTIDPQVNRQNRLYSNDAWTPTEPRLEYDVGDTYRYQKQIRKMIGDEAYSALHAGSYLEEDEIAKRLQNANGDIAEALKGQSALKYAYLKSIGQEPQAPTTEERLDGFNKYKNDQLLAIFDVLSEEEIESLKWDDTEALQKVADILNKQFNETLPERVRLKMLEKPLYDAEDINPHYIQDAYRKYKNAGYQIRTVTDEYALDRSLRSNTEIENDKGYKDWLNEMFKDLIKDTGIRNNKDIFTPSGSRRSFKALHTPATLDNIVAQMKKEQEKGIGIFGVNLRGAATKTYGSVEEMRKDSSKLLGTHIADDVYDSYMDEFNGRLSEIVNRANKRPDSWSSADAARETLLEAVRDAKSLKQMDSMLRREAQFINYSEELAKDLWALRNDVQNMPAPYFEAKPRRIVYPGEALAYILPDNADSDVLSELSDRGYNVLTYKAGDNADRLAKLNSVKGAQFQKLGIGETAEEQKARKESFDNLKAENKILRARAEYWRAQTRTTKERTVRQQDTDRLARELLKKYESRADKAEVKAALKELGDWLVQTDEMDYDELYARAEAIAEDIISGNYALLDNSQQENLDRLKDYLKSTPVNLTQADFRDTGDEGFRKKYGRYFTVRENGRTIDSLWGEMAATFGEGVFPEDVYAPGDMLNMIADYLDMWKPQYGNEFEMFHDEAVNAATNEIIDAILSEDVRQTPGTFADKAQQKLNSQIAKDRERLDALRAAKNARIEELKRQASEKNAQIRLAEKAAKYEAVSKVKKHYQDMLKRQRNKRGDTAMRAKIKKLHKELSDILLKPKEGRYVPRDLVKATAEILGAVDTTSGRAIKAKAAFAELKVKYDALAEDTKYALTYDETVSGMLQSLAEELGDGSIYDLTGTQLEGVYNVLKSLKHTIVTANKLVGAKIEADAFEAANEMMHETENAKAIPNKLLRKFVLTQFTPSSAFRAFGGYKKNSMWEQMFNELNNGQLTQTQILMEGGQIFRELIDDKKNMAKLHDRKNLVDIGLKDDQGNAIKVTRGMMLSVYMHLQNEQNTRHVAYGGLTVPRLAQYYKNQMKDAYKGETGRAVAFATEISDLNKQLELAETVEEQEAIKEKLAELNEKTDAYMSNLRSEIEKQLTEYDRKWIAAAQQFFDVFSKNKLNEVTEMVYGFEKAQVDNYFPIHTDPDYRAASFDSITRNMSLENAGFMKERVNSAKPILLEDITDVISSQLRRTAQYCGLMPAIRNFNKAYGKARAGYSMSVQSALSRKFEGEGQKYIENLMADLNGARKTEANIFDELRGNMAGAVLTLNPRVAMAQAASYPTAASEIGYKPLIKALKDIKNNPNWNEVARDEVAKWTPLWWYRMQGFSTVELGDIKNNEQALSKVLQKMKWATGWIQFMDGATTGALWQASKYYVDENFTDLKKGSDEYMMKVAEVYNRVLEKTQPDYTTMQRPDILRNPNSIVKQLTMFMTQRLQNTNILYDAAATYSHYLRDAEAGRNGVTAADVKQAKTRLVWAVSSQVAAGATIVIFKAIADALMHNLKAYRDDDDELTAESISKTMLTNFAETLTSNVLWGSELFSALKSVVTGDRYYGISLNGVDTFKDILEDGVKTLSKAWKGDWEGFKAPAWKLSKAVAQFFGIPLGNAEKVEKMTANWFEDARNGTWYESDVDRTKAQNTHILFDALQRGDTAKAARIRATFKDKKDEQAAVKSYIQELYTGKDQKIQKAETIKLLQQYAGMTKREAEDLAQKWTMEVVTGIKFSELQDKYIAGEIPKAKAEKYYKDYSSNGRTTEAEAKAKVLEWTCEKETGIAYSDIGTEVKTGRLAKEKAIQMLMKYGGKDQDAATKIVNGYLIEHEYDITPNELEDEYLAGNVSDEEALDILERHRYYGKENAETKAQEELERLKFVKANPDAEDISLAQVRNYNAAGLEGVVDASTYAEAAKMMGTFHGVDADGNGKTDPYSIIIQKLEYIDTLDLDAEQKTRLAQALGISDKNIRRRAPWW